MKIFVLTTGQRALNDSYNQIDYELFVDETHDKVRCYLELLRYVKDMDEDILILEDDVILCKNFKTRLENVVNTYPNDIINFFWAVRKRPKEIFVERFTSGFCYTQCVYYPKGSINKFFDKLVNVKNYPYDSNINQALMGAKMSFISYRPTLVQHIDDDSLIQKGSYIKRVSQVFIDDIERE